MIILARFTEDQIGGDEKLKRFAKSITLSDDELFLFKKQSVINVNIFVGGHDMPFATAVYQDGVLKDSFFNLHKATGDLGIRETSRLADIVEFKSRVEDDKIKGIISKIIRDSLDNYFGKSKKHYHYDQSGSYQLEKDFSFDLMRLKDSLKGLSYDPRSSVYQLNKNAIGDININEFARSLDASIIPYHRCTIKYEVMEKAYSTLNNQFKYIIDCFYFPEKQGKGRIYEKTLRAVNYGNSNKKTRLKNRALVALIDNIIEVQKED